MAEYSKSFEKESVSAPVKRSYQDVHFELASSKKFKTERSEDLSTVASQQFVPIASLTEQFACPAIKGTLTKISESKPSPYGMQYLTFRLSDDSGEITGLACDLTSPNFPKNFKLGATVIISKAKVEKSLPQYRELNGLYRLVIGKFSKVQIESVSSSSSKPNRKMIKAVHDNTYINQIVDVVGIVESVGELARNILLRNIRIVDESEANIVVSLWDDFAKNFEASVGTVIALLKFAVRSADHKKNIRSFPFSQLQIDPQIDEAETLKKWYLRKKSAAAVDVKNESSPKLAETTVPEINIITDHSRSNFTTVTEIKARIPAGKKIDVVGLVVKANPVVETKTKAGNSTFMRELTIMDEEKSNITIAVWGGEVSNRDIPLNSVITATNVLVREYADVKELSCLWCHLKINPDVPQASELKKLIGDNSLLEERQNETTSSNSSVTTEIAFTSIAKLKEEGIEGNKYNIVGLVVDREPVDKITAKSGNVLSMRVVTVADTSDSTMKLSVWGKEVVNHDIPLFSIIEAKNVNIRLYMDEKILNGFWAYLRINPEIPQAHELKNLIEDHSFNEERRNVTASSNSSLKGEITGRLIAYTPIEELQENGSERTTFNIVGVVVKCEAVGKLPTRSGNDLSTRDVIVADKLDSKIKLTVWGNEVDDNDIPLFSVVEVKNVKTRMFDKEISLNCLWANLRIDPEIPQSDELKNLAETWRKIHEKPFLPNDFDAIDEIIKQRKIYSKCSVIGFARKVELETQQTYHKTSWITVIRLEDNEDNSIKLRAWSNDLAEREITLGSVIAVKDATVRNFNGCVVITANWDYIVIEPDVPAAHRLKENATSKIPVKTDSKFQIENVLDEELGDYTPIDVIQKSSKPGDCFNTIGLIVKIDPDKKVTRGNEDFIVKSFVLRDKNGFEINFRILGMNELKNSLGDDSAISLNTVIAVKNAVLMDDHCELSLEADWSCVEINPKIPEADEGSKARRVVSIKRIHEESRPGERLGVLAVVTQNPRIIFPTRRELERRDNDNTVANPTSDNDQEIVCNADELSYVKLIDTSGETINMIISSTIANNLRENSDEIVVVHSINVMVCEYKKRLELSCTDANSFIDVNPDTEEAKTLVAWYQVFRSRKRPNVWKPTPIAPISFVLGNFDDNATASIMGILLETNLRKMEKRGIEFESRRIRIIDDSEKCINVLLWNAMARDFNVSLHSVILIRNFCFHTRGPKKWGDCMQETKITENPSDEKNLSTTERLKIWFPEYQRQLKNLMDAGVSTSDVEKKSNFSSNDGKIVEESRNCDKNEDSVECKEESNLDCSDNEEAFDRDTDSPDLFSD